MKAKILGEWEMELPEKQPGEEEWFLDWVLRSPHHAGNHIACSYLSFHSLREVIQPGEIENMREYFGGLGTHSIMLQDLFEPKSHVVGDYSAAAVVHLMRALAHKNVTVWQADAFAELPSSFYAEDDMVVLDIGNLTIFKAQPDHPEGALLDRVFAGRPKAVTLTDIACRYMHLHVERYEGILGAGACDSYETYLSAFGEHIRTRYGYALHQVNYTPWSAVMAYVPEDRAIPTSGQVIPLRDCAIPGLMLTSMAPVVVKKSRSRKSSKPKEPRAGKPKPSKPSKTPATPRPRAARKVKTVPFNVEAFDRYLAFVSERHRIWEQRQAGLPAPWTEDPVLASRKFTNVFRVLDPGSQFVLTDLAEPDGSRKDILMRLFLYRHTGRVGPWRHLRHTMGDYPTLETLEEALGVWKEYRRTPGAEPVFTGAYLVYPQSALPGTDKLEAIFDLTARLFRQEGLAEEFFAAETQRDRFAAFRRHKGVADFMSMQILTDWGYTPYGEDLEDEFVVPGPGAKKGIAAITDTRKPADFIRFAQMEVHAGDDCPTLDLGSGLRYPSIMDIQNTLCEFSKYERYLRKGTSAKSYRPAHPGKQLEPVLPAHWNTTTR